MRAPQPVRLSKDIVPISEFKAKVAEFFSGLGEQPLVVTQHGKPSGVVLSPSLYDALMSTAFLADVREGLADIEAGRVHEHADVMAEARAVIARAKGRAKARPPKRR
jgi:prevent-host-death family protein